MSSTTPAGKSSDSFMADNEDEQRPKTSAALSDALLIEGGPVHPNHTQSAYDKRKSNNSLRSLSLAPETGHASSHGRRREPPDLSNGLHSSDGSETIADPGNIHEPASNRLQQLVEAQHLPLTPHLTASTNPSSPNSNTSRAVSPAGRLRQELEELRQRQESARILIEGSPRTPQWADFPPSLSMSIVAPTTEPEVEHCVILLHQSTGNEESLGDLAKSLRRSLPESAFVLIRGLQAVRGGNSGYHWADAPWEARFIQTSTVILDQVIKDVLMSKCRFQPQNIVILGYGEGGMAALAAAASWQGFELGGVVSIGGPMPDYVQLEPSVRAKTPALIIGGALGEMNASALQLIQESFIYTYTDIRKGEHDLIPETQEQLKPLWDFFAHRLRREEWNKQAVISCGTIEFLWYQAQRTDGVADGGGVRGLGSLLILQDLMNKIGDLEKSLGGPEAESSFAPSAYRPMPNQSSHTDADINTLPSPSGNECPIEPEDIIPTPTHEVPNSSLFLPCHYFDYAAGTSTGGLISIMLSRLRMTVDECIDEYKTLGDKVFGHPRIISSGGTLWHKLDCKVFEKVIRDVTAKYCEKTPFESTYAMDRMDQDMCQCIVLAYADIGTGESPYLFRTYPTPPPPSERTRTEYRSHSQALRNHGDAHILPIWQVARATSAAPRYFPPMRIRSGNGPEVVTFKDGGFGSNNPSEEAYYDIANKHGGSQNMGPFISIGTGSIPLKMFPGRERNFRNLRDTIANLKTVMKLPSMTAMTHNKLKRICNDDGKQRFPYYRFDGGDRLGKVGLGEWKSHRYTFITGRDNTPGCKTLAEIEAATAIYLRRPDVQRDLKEVAKILVERRRLRTRNESDWDRYASFSYYECDFRGCNRKRINTAQKFKEHIRKRHASVDDRVLEAQLKGKRRIYWVYRSKS